MYDSGRQIDYTLPLSASPWVLAGIIKPPLLNPEKGATSGKAQFGRILDVQVFITTTFTATTLPGLFTVGNANLDARILSLSIPTTAAPTSFGLSDQPTALKTLVNGTDAGAVAQPWFDLGAGGLNIASLFWNMVSPTGGSPAGTGVVQLSILWW